MVTTPLRERMRAILRTRNYSPRTEQTYITAVARFARHFGRSPEDLGRQQIDEYQIWLREVQRISASLFNQTMSALKFLYREVLGRNDIIERIPFARRERRLPVVLSPDPFSAVDPQRSLSGADDDHLLGRAAAERSAEPAGA